jgi:hypothetical protein
MCNSGISKRFEILISVTPRLPSLELTINHKGFVAVHQTGEDMDFATHREGVPVVPNLWFPAQVRVLRQKTGTAKYPAQPIALTVINLGPRVLNLLDTLACETQNEEEIQILILRFGPRPELQIRPDASGRQVYQ